MIAVMPPRKILDRVSVSIICRAIGGEPDFKAVCDFVRAQIHSLAPRDAAVLSAILGLEGPAESRGILARKMGVSSERVRQIEVRAAKKITVHLYKRSSAPRLG
jgi:hypothetical protein